MTLPRWVRRKRTTTSRRRVGRGGLGWIEGCRRRWSWALRGHRRLPRGHPGSRKKAHEWDRSMNVKENLHLCWAAQTPQVYSHSLKNSNQQPPSDTNREQINSPTPITVAFNSGGGILSNTPALTSGSNVNKLANSTALC